MLEETCSLTEPKCKNGVVVYSPSFEFYGYSYLLTLISR